MHGTRFVPITLRGIIQLAVVIALPLAPLVLTMIPLEQIIDRVMRLMV
jgi:hypothetical protein